jgi:O-antigen/teichoic acid export membrane protein
MSRLTKTILNAKVGVFFHLLFIFVQFFARKIFLDNLGDDFIGTVSTLQAFLGFLNLAELGIGTAIGFVLYKPIFDNNTQEINQIIRFLGHIYKKIGFIIIGIAILLGACFPFIFHDTPVPLGLVYYAFIVFLAGSLFGYFFNYHIFLLQADQKDFMVTKVFQGFNISKIVLQIIAVLFFESFFLYLTLELVSNLAFTIVIRKKLKKEYPWLSLSYNKEDKIKDFENYPFLVKKIKQISLHKLGTFISGGTNDILIFSFINAQSVAFFGNYNLLIANADLLIGKLFSGTNASVGNLIAEKNDEKNQQIFWELMSLRFFIGGVGFIGIITLIDPFIQVWLGEKYILSLSVLMVFGVNFFLGQVRQPVDVFKQGFGLYADTWAPVAQGVINLAVSFALAKPLGLTGILLGNTASLLIIVMIWRPYYIYKEGFENELKIYVWGFLQHLVLLFLYIVMTYYIVTCIPLEIDSFIGVGIKILIVLPVATLVYGVLLYSTQKHFRDLVKRLYSGFSKKTN